MATVKAFCSNSQHNRNEPACLFCDNCKEPICTNCVTTEHRGHIFSNIDTAINAIQQNIQQQIQNGIKESQDMKNSIKTARTNRQSDFVRLKKTINERYDYLRDQLDREKSELISKLDKEEGKDLSNLKAIEAGIDKNIGNFTTLQTKCKEATSAKNPTILAKYNQDIETITSKHVGKDFKLPTLAELEFRDSESKPPFMGELLFDADLNQGSDFVDFTLSSIEYELEIISQYQTKLTKVESICTNGSEEAWLGYSNSNRIICLHEENGLLEKSQSLRLGDFYPINARHMPNGNLIFSTAAKPYIKIIDAHSKIKTFVETSPLLPLGIHINKVGEVFACLLDDFDTNVIPASVRKVVKYSKFGKIQLDIEYDQSKLRYFCLPQSVTQNINGDICVVDVTGKHEGRLQVFTATGKRRFTYDGKANTRNSKCDLSYCTHDKDGNIVISDEHFNLIHCITKDGNFLGFLSTEADKIYRPFGVEIDTEGFLWVGCKAAATSEAAQVLHLKFHVKGM